MRILNEYFIGYSLINPKKARDIDILRLVSDDDLVVSRELETRDDVQLDVLTKSTGLIKRQMDYDWSVANKLDLLCYNWQLDIDIIKQNFPIVFHLTDKTQEQLKVLETIFLKGRLNCNPNIAIELGSITNAVDKKLYNVAATCFILLNKKAYFTDKQLNVIERIHDYQVG